MGELNGFHSLGDWIQRRRKALDLTQADLAQKVGCAVVTIKKIEREERRPSQQMALLLAEHLAIPDAMQDAFMELARGKFVTPDVASMESLRLPAFLNQEGQASQPETLHFVGRRRELARLEAALDQVLAGNGRPLFLLGDAGSGKTTLMAEFALRATGAHPHLLTAGGEGNAQAGAGDPYRPFRDILKMLTGDIETQWGAGWLSQKQARRLWESIPDTVRALTQHGPNLVNLLLPVAPLVQRVAPFVNGPADWLNRIQALARTDQPLDFKREQDRVLEELTQVLRAVATRQPLLLLLDDLQWIDEASKNLLFHLGRRLAGSRILLVGAYRPGEVAAEPPADAPQPAAVRSIDFVILELARQYGEIQINLNEASYSEGRAFVDALLDREPNALDNGFRERLFQHTQGQPLFTVEVLRSLQESGYLVQDSAGRWVENATPVSYPLPARVEAVIEQRLGRLSEALRELLSVASVEGEVFTAEALADVLGTDLRTVLHQLSRDLKQRHRLVRALGETAVGPHRLNRFQFSHGLFQEYLYDQLSPGEKRLLHRGVAQALERALLGRAAEPALAPRAELGTAAPEKREGLGPDGLDAFGPALVNQFWLGEAWDKAAEYALQVGKQARNRFAMREAISYCERALSALDNQAGAPYALVHEAILRWEEAAFNFRPYQDQLNLLTRAETLARDHQDQARLIEALHWKANVFLARGLWTRAGPTLVECLALAEALGDERLLIRPTFFKGLMTTFADPQSALTLLYRALALARKYADLHVEAIALGNIGQVYAQLGQFAQSHTSMQAARQVASRLGSPLTESDVDLLAAWSYIAMGDTPHGLEFGQRSVDRAIATDNMDCICSGLACIGYGNLELRHIPEAIAAFKEGIERSEHSGAIIPRLHGQAGLATAQFFDGRADAVEDIENVLSTMREYQFYVGEANANQMLGSCLAQLGSLDRAEVFLNRAVDSYRRSEMRPFLMKALLSQADLLEKQGRNPEAQKSRVEAEALRQAFTAQ